jgi:transketolase
VQSETPVYIRIGKKGEPVLFPEPPAFEFGRWNCFREGEHVTLLAAGNTLPIATAAADLLAASGVSARVYSCASVKPLDEKVLAEAFGGGRIVATIEEHAKACGFGSSVAEWVADLLLPDARLLRFGAADEFLHEAGEQDHAREAYGITAQQVASRVLALAKS